MAPTHRAATRAGLFAASLVLVATGCSAAGDEDAANEGAAADGAAAGAADDSSAPADGSGARSDTAAPGPLSFKTETVDGGTFDGAALAGEPVVLWFWAPWCTICRAEAPEVAAIAADFEGEVTFVGVAGLGQTDAMRTFVKETGTDGMQHAIDADGSVWQSFGVVSQPAFAFVASDGSVETFAGSLPPDDLERAATGLADG